MSRRDEIKAIARRQFAERGFGSASMRDIADESGLLAGSLYSHFRSKSDLVAEIVSSFYDNLIPCQHAAIAAGGTGREQLRRMIESVCEVCARHREELTILHYDWYALSRLEGVEGLVERSVETLDLWRTAIATGRDDGSLNADIDTDVLMRIITSSVHALIDTVRYADRPLETTTNPRIAEMLATVVLDGAAVGERQVERG